MRPNNSSKRTRSRSRGKNTNPLARSYESNGPDVKIRGSAIQVADKYAQLARDAQSSGDRVMAENYFQHAEHYYRIVAQAYEQNQQPNRDRRDDNERSPRPDDRQQNPRGIGDQPVINGFDGLEDDDGNARRARPVNGHANGASDEVIEAAQGESEGEAQATVITDATEANGHVNGTAAETVVVEATVEEKVPAAAAAEEEAAAAPAEEAPKPKRRARSTRTRTRKRAEPDAAAEVAAPAESADPAAQ